MTVSEEQRSADTPQRLFRMVNERIRYLNEPFSSSVKASWFCECANGECFERVDMLLADYEDVQRHADRFLVAPSAAHVSPEIENVIERQHSHWVVQQIRPTQRLSRAVADKPSASGLYVSGRRSPS
jgi:hypothetical protein